MKRNLIKLTGALLLATTVFTMRPKTAEAAWNKDDTGWWYTEGKSWAKDGWRYIDGNWYYFDKNGYMAENTTIDGYYVDSTGKWIPSYVDTAAKTANTEASAGTNAATNAGTVTDIGEEKAKEIAFNNAGVTADAVSSLKVKNDYENKIKVYEVEFINNNVKYEYDINVVSGEIVSCDKENIKSASGNGTTSGSGSTSGNGTSNGSGSTSGSTESSDIGIEKAKQIALSHAGVTASVVSSLKVKTDYENKIKVYEVEFKNNNIKYEYEINAVSGNIVSSDKEYIKSASGNGATSGSGSTSGNGTSNGSGSTTGSAESSDIGVEKAKQIALSHAGVTANAVSSLKVKTDYENKIKVYEIEFKKGNMEYEYEINVSNGSIVKYDSEYDD